MDIIKQAFTRDIFDGLAFGKALAPLKQYAVTAFAKAQKEIPEYEDPSEVELPDVTETAFAELKQIIQHARRAMAFSQWYIKNKQYWMDIKEHVIGSEKDGAADTNEDVLTNGMHGRLARLQVIVESAKPVQEALSKVDNMTKLINERMILEERLKEYAEAAEAINPLLGIEQLVDAQVTALMQQLETDAHEWKKVLYNPAYVGAPSISAIDAGADDVLHLDAGQDGVSAPAMDISNASDLRATLLALLFAYWEHLWKTKGGLSLILLDDIQELFDDNNLERLTSALPKLAEKGARLLVTTNSRAFRKRLEKSATRTLGNEKVEVFQIHTLNTNRGHIELTHLKEAVENKQKIFEANENDDDKAWEYMNEARIFLEEELIDLLDPTPSELSASPTLSELICAIRNQKKSKVEPYSSGAFAKLVDDACFNDGSAFLNIMNACHHDRRNEITWNAVKGIDSDCERALKRVTAAWDQRQTWMRRDALPDEQSLAPPKMPETLEFPQSNIPLTRLAASGAESGGTSTEFEQEDFPLGDFPNHALYRLNTDNLGFAAERNDVVIVALDEREVPANSLVIALHNKKIYARRLHCSSEDPEICVLTSSGEDPRFREADLVLPTEEATLLPIVGVLYSPPMPSSARITDEAALDKDFSIFKRVELCFRVHGESAVPAVLDGQILLGGSELNSTVFDNKHELRVAIASSDEGYFKKVGTLISGHPHLRQFDPIGPLGKSVILRVEESEAADDAPKIVTAREVLGVLFGE